MNIKLNSIPTGAEPQPTAELFAADAVATLLNCSKRHIFRLSDSGRMPAPLKIGALCRWRRGEILNWIDGGCRPVRRAGQ